MLDHGLDLAELARDAIARGADCLGMAGGDGSQALVASHRGRARSSLRVRRRGHPEPLRPRPRSRSRGPSQERVRLPRRRRAPRRLRHGQRPVLRQQRLAGRLRHHRAAGGLPGGQGRHDQAAAAPSCWARREQPFDLQFVTPDGTEVDGVLPDHGVEQPLRPGGLAWTRPSAGGSTRGGSASSLSRQRRAPRRPRWSPWPWPARGGQRPRLRVHCESSRCGHARARPTPASTARRSS